MHLSTFLRLALMAATATAIPSSIVPKSVSEAEARGIDVNGPIPDDAVKTEAGYYTAEPGTDAWAWIKAQIDLPPADETSDSAVEKREYASIGIGMFAQDNCNGQAAWFDNVQYDVQHVDYISFYSVGVSYRGLRENEQLDFSRRSGDDWCGQYLYSAAPQTPIGCWNSQLINCFRLTRW